MRLIPGQCSSCHCNVTSLSLHVVNFAAQILSITGRQEWTLLFPVEGKIRNQDCHESD
jgi:hypothetical protein